MDEKTLKHLYIDLEWSMERIGNKFDKAPSTIRKILISYGVKPRTKQEAIKLWRAKEPIRKYADTDWVSREAEFK